MVKTEKNEIKEIKVFAPATVANLSCGFDVLGLALDNPGDIVTIRLVRTPGVVIKKITHDNGKLPYDSQKNTAGVAVIEYLHHMNLEVGVEIEIEKNLPLGSGMGSSGASAVAALWGINYLMGNKLSPGEMLPFAMEAEKVACGSAHADNVAPGLFGGLVLIRSYNPLDVVKLPFPKNICVVLIHPHVEIRTEEARKILPEKIALKKAVSQWGNIGGFISGIYTENYDLIKRSMVDIIVEPIRGKLIPFFFDVKNIAEKNGAIGCGISGSGPSIFAFCPDQKTAANLSNIVKSFYDGKSIASEVYISQINNKGPKILREKVK